MIRKKRYLLLSIFLVLSIYTIQLIVKSLYVIDACMVRVDPIISSSYAQAISHRIQQLSHEKPPLLFSRIQKEYPCIKYISCRYDARHIMKVYVGVFQPILQLNKEQAVLENHACVAAHWYQDTILAQKAHVNATPHVSIQSLVAFYEQLPELIKLRFHADWRTDYDIRLYDTVHKDSVLVSRVDAIPTMELLKAYDQIIDNNKKYTIDEKEKNEKWIADGRFAHQLIFSSQKGEYYESRSV